MWVCWSLQKLNWNPENVQDFRRVFKLASLSGSSYWVLGCRKSLAKISESDNDRLSNLGVDFTCTWILTKFHTQRKYAPVSWNVFDRSFQPIVFDVSVSPVKVLVVILLLSLRGLTMSLSPEEATEGFDPWNEQLAPETRPGPQKERSFPGADSRH